MPKISVEVPAELPCISLPDVPSDLGVMLPSGAELKAFGDFSMGMPSDCTLTFNLMVQLAPALASLSCIIKIVNVIQKLQGVVEGLPTLDFGAVPDLAQAIADAAPCFAMTIPASIIITVKGVLEVIIKFLSCFLQHLESVVNFQASIDLSAAEGNPALENALTCAQDNAALSMEHLMAALGPVQPLLDMVGSLADAAQLSITLPAVSDMSLDGDPTQTISDMRHMVDQLQQVIETLPG